MKNDFERELEKVKKHVEWLKKHPNQAELFLQIIGVYDEDGNLTKEFGGGGGEQIIPKERKKQLNHL